MSANDVLPYLSALTALLTVSIGVGVWRLGRLQQQTNALRLKHELFERRYKVYDSFISFISDARVEGKTSQAACLSFRIETQPAVFLFGPEIPAYLESVFQKGLALLQSARQLSSEGEAIVGAERTRVIRENSEQVKWMGD